MVNHGNQSSIKNWVKRAEAKRGATEAQLFVWREVKAMNKVAFVSRFVSHFSSPFHPFAHYHHLSSAHLYPSSIHRHIISNVMEAVQRRRSLRVLANSPNIKCECCAELFKDKKDLTRHLVTAHLSQCDIRLRRLSGENKKATDSGESGESHEETAESKPPLRRSARLSSKGSGDTVEAVDLTISDKSDEVVVSATKVTSSQKSRQKYSQIAEPIESDSLVFFDVETSGTGNTNEIVEIAARHGHREFQSYCTPTKPMNIFASRVNKITFKAGQLYYKNKPVASRALKDVLKEFIDWLNQLPKRGQFVVLVAHNAKFDSRFLIKHVIEHSLHDAFQQVAKGFVDTLPMFRVNTDCAFSLNVTRSNFVHQGLLSNVRIAQTVVLGGAIFAGQGHQLRGAQCHG